MFLSYPYITNYPWSCKSLLKLKSMSNYVFISIWWNIYFSAMQLVMERSDQEDILLWLQMLVIWIVAFKFINFILLFFPIALKVTCNEELIITIGKSIMIFTINFIIMIIITILLFHLFLLQVFNYTVRGSCHMFQTNPCISSLHKLLRMAAGFLRFSVPRTLLHNSWFIITFRHC